jgi:hypothetical protein
MPNDPLSPVFPGQPLAISAAGWNEVMEATKEVRRRGRSDGAGNGRRYGPVEALALNDTGADLREFKPAKVVGAGGYTLTADAGYHWADLPVVTLDTPAASTDIIAVTLEAIKDGEFGRVAVAGWCACDCDISDSGHGYASPTTDTDALVSGATGSIRILATGTGTARRTAVYLGDQVGGAAGASLSYAESYLTADFDITTGLNSWTASSAPDVTSVTIPSDGTYLIQYTVTGILNTNIVGERLLAAVFVDDGGGADLVPHTTSQFCRIQVANVEQSETVHVSKIDGFDAGDEIILKAIRYAGAGVVTTSRLHGTLVTADDPDYYPVTGLHVIKIG